MNDEVDKEKDEEDTVPVLHQMSRYGARKLGNFLDLPPDEVHSLVNNKRSLLCAIFSI